MDFKTQLGEYQKLVNDELARVLDVNANESHQLYGHYVDGLFEAEAYSALAGGKRLRPALTLATYRLFSDDIEECLPFAVALEMAHNFSLIHDDLPGIDNDDFRHGKPTNHKQFGEATAILAGDGLLNGAYMVMTRELFKSSLNLKGDTPEKLKRRVRVTYEFAAALDRMIAGEYVDTLDEGKDIDANELQFIHENKTGALLTFAVRQGATLGGASDNELDKLSSYARKIGLAFQIKDDILSEEGDEKVTGKPVGNDREMGKATYVAMYGLEKSKEMVSELISEAIAELNDFDEKADFLRELAEYIGSRNK